MVEHIPVVPRDEIKLPRHQNGQKIDSQLEARFLIDAAALTLPVAQSNLQVRDTVRNLKCRRSHLEPFP